MATPCQWRWAQSQRKVNNLPCTPQVWDWGTRTCSTTGLCHGTRRLQRTATLKRHRLGRPGESGVDEDKSSLDRWQRTAITLFWPCGLLRRCTLGSASCVGMSDGWRRTQRNTANGRKKFVHHVRNVFPMIQPCPPPTPAKQPQQPHHRLPCLNPDPPPHPPPIREQPLTSKERAVLAAKMVENAESTGGQASHKILLPHAIV